jgi:hypothetical protein
MIVRPNFATHPLDEFWARGTSIYCQDEGGNGECLLCECVSEHTAQGIVAVLRYHNHVATQFSYTGPTPPKLSLVKRCGDE